MDCKADKLTTLQALFIYYNNYFNHQYYGLREGGGRGESEFPLKNNNYNCFFYCLDFQPL